MEIFVNNTQNNTNTVTIYPYYLILMNLNTPYEALHNLQDRSSKSFKNALKYIMSKITTIKSLLSIIRICLF
jgi:hypothetical protein